MKERENLDVKLSAKPLKGFSSQQYYVGLVSLIVLFLVLLNIYALRPIGFGNFAIDEFGTIFIVLVMILQNVIAEIWGKKTAYKVTIFSIVVKLFIVFLTVLAVVFPYDADRADLAENFNTVFKSHWRIELASMLSFAIASLINIYFFVKINAKLKKYLSGYKIVYLIATALSAIVSRLLDNALFNTLAFAPVGLSVFEFDWRTLIFVTINGAALQLFLEVTIVAVAVMHLAKRIKQKKLQEENIKLVQTEQAVQSYFDGEKNE
ncbi:MAG: queuosine precursor transporter [Clostridiales bacterium]|jgi:uncharacterized integral membrane protein (TIGR00697 family)|nr:queuosine precursor transporter [Clostridiales bacterium]